MDKKFIFWWRWLVAATCGVLAFGLLLVVLPGPMEALLNRIYFSTPPGNPVFGEAAAHYIRFVSAVLGAVMIGWSVALLFILFKPFRSGQAWGWQAVSFSIAAWFLPDTSFSLWSGFWQNALLNALFLILFAVPLIATMRDFKTTGNRQKG